MNAVNLKQAAGFLSRVRTGSMAINQLLGYGMMALAVPATLALVAFWRARADWLQWVGPAVYLAFVALMVVVEYVWPVEFRSPTRYGILVPYLLLFFGAILLDIVYSHLLKDILGASERTAVFSAVSDVLLRIGVVTGIAFFGAFASSWKSPAAMAGCWPCPSPSCGGSPRASSPSARSGGRGSGSHGFHTVDSQTRAIVLDELKPIRGGVLGNNPALVLHQLGSVSEFSAGGSAQIQNRFAGLRSQFAHSQQGAGVLHIKAALLETP